MAHGATPIRALVLLLSGPALAACTRSGPAFESVSTLPTVTRRPAGTDVDPELTLPPRSRRGETSEGLVVLEGPADPAEARASVAAFFRAVSEESLTSLEAVLLPQAIIQSGSRREPARTHFQVRFARLDYRGLGAGVYRDADLELWERGPAAGEGSGAPLTPNERELVARIRMLQPAAGPPRLFGDELVFRLVPTGRTWSISEIVEDFRVP